MTRNDTFYKILFAIEIALIPLVLASFYMMADWTVGLFIAGVLVAKIWMELFKDKNNFTHKLLASIANVWSLVTLIIFFTVQGYLEVVLCVFVVILLGLTNIFKICLHNKTMPETIDAVDTCYTLFECFALVGMTFVVFNQMVTNIALFAILLTAIVSVAYKIYFVVKYTNLMSNIKDCFIHLKNLFKRK